MKLIIDIGNSYSKIAIFNENTIVNFETLPSININYIELLYEKFPQISSSILSSVALHDTKINELLKRKGFFVELDYNTSVPFINKYSTPATLGKDRIAIASAAAQMYPNNNTLIIDVGTCVTYDMLTNKNEYIGGSISPGLKMRFTALHNFTHKLPLINLPNHDLKIGLVGNSTEASILSGVINGLAAEIESIVNQYSSMYSPLKIIISGGDHKYFERLLKSNIFATSNIVVTGLMYILNFNEKN